MRRSIAFDSKLSSQNDGSKSMISVDAFTRMLFTPFRFHRHGSELPPVLPMFFGGSLRRHFQKAMGKIVGTCVRSGTLKRNHVGSAVVIVFGLFVKVFKPKTTTHLATSDFHSEELNVHVLLSPLLESFVDTILS